jgi:phosphoribosylaminoimidazole (AIR) synthetase
MYQTFNMGMGFSIVVSNKDSDEVVDALGGGAKKIGQAVRGGRVTVPSLAIGFDRY